MARAGTAPRPDPQLSWLLTHGPCLLCSGLSPQEPGLAQDWNAAEGDEESEDSPVSWGSPPLLQTPLQISVGGPFPSPPAWGCEPQAVSMGDSTKPVVVGPGVEGRHVMGSVHTYPPTLHSSTQISDSFPCLLIRVRVPSLPLSVRSSTSSVYLLVHSPTDPPVHSLGRSSTDSLNIKHSLSSHAPSLSFAGTPCIYPVICVFAHPSIHVQSLHPFSCCTSL